MSDEKPTNPKDAIGSNKLPLHLFPTTARSWGCIALLDGALKYGRSNFRAVGVRASIYYDAVGRHMDAWFEGEDFAPDSEILHLAHALAGIAILIEAHEAGNMTDDRMYPLDGDSDDFRNFVDWLTEDVARLKESHADKDPYHYTIDRRGDGDRDLNAPLPEGWEVNPDEVTLAYAEEKSWQPLPVEITQELLDDQIGIDFAPGEEEEDDQILDPMVTGTGENPPQGIIDASEEEADGGYFTIGPCDLFDAIRESVKRNAKLPPAAELTFETAMKEGLFAEFDDAVMVPDEVAKDILEAARQSFFDREVLPLLADDTDGGFVANEEFVDDLQEDSNRICEDVCDHCEVISLQMKLECVESDNRSLQGQVMRFKAANIALLDQADAHIALKDKANKYAAALETENYGLHAEKYEADTALEKAAGQLEAITAEVEELRGRNAALEVEIKWQRAISKEHDFRNGKLAEGCIRNQNKVFELQKAYDRLLETNRGLAEENDNMRSDLDQEW